MNEKDKIQLDKLEEYVKDYILFIDTCSLMFEEADLFWEHILPLLKKYGKKINMPYKCWLELRKHSMCGDIRSARQAIQIVRRYQEQGYISVKEGGWEDSGTFADNVFLTVFNMYRTRYNLLLITQDADLSKDILKLNEQNAVSGKRCLAKRINRYGFLNHYDWEEDEKEDGYSAAPHKQTDSSSLPFSIEKEKFKLCTVVGSIPADPVHLSYVPHENDYVIANNGEIRLGSKIASGGEGAVFETNTPYVAKIYHDGKLTKRKYEKIGRLLKKQLKCEGICFPVAGLYNKNKEFVGYLMPMAKGKELQKSIFIKGRFLELFPNWKKKDLVRLCITILKKIKYLHDRNIIIGDINARNILVVSPTEVYFVDTDSYQIEDLPCPVGVVTFTPPELQGKTYNSFLRTMGNENFAVATLMFMLMLSGKSTYAQLGGADVATNIKNMDFPYPCGDKSNQKTPDGPWGYIWSHLSFNLKEAFYETFQKGGKYSTEQTRLSVSDWEKLFKQYYYELTDPQGNMLKNDAMSGELFPTRLKKSPNINYVTCRLCKQEVAEGFSKSGICNNCLHLSAGKCKRCGKDLDFTNYDRYVKNKNVPELCNSCMEANYSICGRCGKKFLKTGLKNGICADCQTYKIITCSACGKSFEITYGEKEFYDKKGYELPKRCQTCRENGVSPQSNFSARRSHNALNMPITGIQNSQKRAMPQILSVDDEYGLSRILDDGYGLPHSIPFPYSKESQEEKLKIKKRQARTKVQRICEDKIRSIEGTRPDRVWYIGQYFRSLIWKIDFCMDFDEIDDCVAEAEKFNIDHFG